jgi:Mg2+-importing ATPase
LHTAIAGLTQAEAEERARTSGPNEVAQERRRGWFIRLLIICVTRWSFCWQFSRRFPLPPAMRAPESSWRAWLCSARRSASLQEARADSAAAKLKAMIHVTATVVRDGKAREIPLRDLVPGDIINLSAGDMIPGDVRVHRSERFLRQPGNAHRGVASRGEVSRSRPQGC